MDLMFGPSLGISPFWQIESKVILVGRLDASRLCRDGEYEALGPFQALWDFGRLWPKNRWAIRRFVADAGLSRFPLSSLDEYAVNHLIKDGIGLGDLVAIKKVDPAVLAARPVDPAVAKRHLIREIEAKTGGKLTEAGRHYRLIRDIDFEKFPERNYYHVVRQDEAKQILDALAKQPGTSTELAELLVKARDQITRDWHALTEPDGLILLRRAPVERAPEKDTGPAITPSQMRKLKLGWIAIECVEESEQPWKGKVDMFFSDGASRGTAADPEGIVHVENIEPGDATISFKDKDAAT